MTPLQIKHEIESAIVTATRNGFTLDIGNEIEIIANREPYAKNVCIKRLASFADVITFFEGYDQMRLEQRELNRVKNEPIQQKLRPTNKTPARLESSKTAQHAKERA